MMAAVFAHPGRIELREKPVPEVGPLDALVRITTATICGTDVNILKGEYPVAEGLTVGHEPVGVVERRFPVDGRPVSVEGIRTPFFVVGTGMDRIAPWRSVHEIHLAHEDDMTFLPASGGHDAGIVSEPGHPHRNLRLRHRPTGIPCLGPDERAAAAERRDGSWWPEWAAWLGRLSGEPAAPLPLGAAGDPALDDAPGRYVRLR